MLTRWRHDYQALPSLPGDRRDLGLAVQVVLRDGQGMTQPLIEHFGSVWTVLEGDCREQMKHLDAGSVQTCVTSPPYYSLRDYGHAGQIGLEPTPDEFVQALVGVFREVRRVLRDDGTVWLNLGDSYASSPGANNANLQAWAAENARGGGRRAGLDPTPRRTVPEGYKPKDLLGIPWMVAFALRAAGWYLRSDIIWSKPNPMPESVTDRPTKAHEYLFLLSKSTRYFYDADAIAEDALNAGETVALGPKSMSVGQATGMNREPSGNGKATAYEVAHRRNKRTVWTVATQPYAGAHFATFPPKLIEPCILAGSREGDTVLDPFAGSGTTGMVALRHGRSFVGCELSPEYAELARCRIVDDAPLLNANAEVAAWPSV